jgi:hypothetical protein
MHYTELPKIMDRLYIIVWETAREGAPVSDNWLYYVPRDPNWQPTRQAAESAAALLREMAPQADEVGFEFHDKLNLFHPFTNWSGVRCPACSADLEDWWDSAVGPALENEPQTLAAVTPCCGMATSLNDVDFGWPTAFGRFALVAMNPGLKPSPAKDQAIADRLGTAVRTVWQHL